MSCDRVDHPFRSPLGLPRLLLGSKLPQFVRLPSSCSFTCSARLHTHRAAEHHTEEHVYLPILPPSFRWALESPAPFLMGMAGKAPLASELAEDAGHSDATSGFSPAPGMGRCKMV